MLSNGLELLIRKMCLTLRRPRFEIESWPASELEWWSTVFAISDKDKPIIEKPKPESITVNESRSKFRELFG